MTEVELKKLKGYSLSLSGFMRVLQGVRKPSISDNSFRPLANELYRVQANFPDLLPSFAETQFITNIEVSRMRGDAPLYDLIGLRGYLALAIGNIEAALDTFKGIPVTETREFSFIQDMELRKVIERDYTEIQRAFVTNCYKSVIILSGGTIEAILLDLLQQHTADALAASKAPKGKALIASWGLSDLINVAVELNLVDVGVEKLSHSLREYRNLSSSWS